MPRPIHEPDYRQLMDVLRQARLRSQLDQAAVAEQLGRPQSFVSKYENGERTLNVIEFVSICGILGLNPAHEIELIGRRPRLRPRVPLKK